MPDTYVATVGTLESHESSRIAVWCVTRAERQALYSTTAAHFQPSPACICRGRRKAGQPAADITSSGRGRTAPWMTATTGLSGSAGQLTSLAARAEGALQ